MLAKALRNAPLIYDRLRSHLKLLRLSIAYPDTILRRRAVTLCRNSHLIACDGGTLFLGNHVAVGVNARIEAKGGIIEIGSNSFIGQGTIIVANNRISVGANALIAEYVTIRDQDHAFEIDKITAENGMRSKPIIIGANVWIGAKATITKGVSIGDNSVIAANAVVTRDVPANSVMAGIPAKLIRTLDVGTTSVKLKDHQ